MVGRFSFFAGFLASVLAATTAMPVAAADNRQATADPASLAELDLAAETRGDVAGALALYGDDAIVQYGGAVSCPQRRASEGAGATAVRRRTAERRSGEQLP